MPEEATQALAQFAAALTYEQIPDRVKEHCKNLLLDALACALAGHQGEETHQVAALASSLAQSSETSVIGGDRLSLAGATLFNGYLVTAVTMCDAHRSTMTHVTPEVMPPALAIAERDDLSGRDLLVAIAAGCEVTTRIGIGLDYPAFRARGFHGPGVLGPFGAAAAPNGPSTPGPCQPLARNAAGSRLIPMRVITSLPTAIAASTSAPESPSRSAISSVGGTTSGVICVMVGRCTSHMVTAVMR